MDRSALLWSALDVLNAQRRQAILEVYGSLAEAQKHLGEELLRGLGCRPETVQKVLLRLEEFDVEAYAAELEKRGIAFLQMNDEAYPEKLRAMSDPPSFLYAKGDLSILDHPCVACVGTREMSQYGRRVTEEMVSGLVAGGVVTVSGLAHGIDAAVAEVTLRSGGRTVAVLGHGLGMIYPQSHVKLAEQIMEGGGLLLSEFPLDRPPETYTFPARNRIIAGLSLATVVLEAPEGSGALITAEFALEDGRDVFAVPGQMFDANYAGCHALIAKNRAMLVTGPADVLREIGIIAPESAGSSYQPRTEEEGTAFAVLTTMPQSSDDLAAKSGLSPGRLAAVLTMMELSGGAKNVGGGMWVRR